MDSERLDLRDLLQGSAWDQDHLLAIGRIVELTATLEWQARWLMGLALHIDDPEVIEALFLGERFGMLQQRLDALSKFYDDEGKYSSATYLADVAEWARSVKKAVERRDALLHRPPASIVINGVRRPALGRSRRSQQVEPIDRQALQLVADLVALAEQGSYLMSVEAMG